MNSIIKKKDGCYLGLCCSCLYCAPSGTPLSVVRLCAGVYVFKCWLVACLCARLCVSACLLAHVHDRAHKFVVSIQLLGKYDVF